MQTVNIADLKNNLSAWLEQVKNGEELIVKDRNKPIAWVKPHAAGEDLDAGRGSSGRRGIDAIACSRKKDDFLDLSAPQVSTEDSQTAIRAERDEDQRFVLGYRAASFRSAASRNLAGRSPTLARNAPPARLTGNNRRSAERD